ncbi:hypothetical protein ADL22_08375 [Streptomyces sp. NRRL F-4489]|uniref:protein kinase n=1 Tax=Streptomyces sp. NRRL F-4489 TaxID=1609095 RepID=UPI000749AFC3|nr:protein kinase [Streptomyces sp. NRRL F-4489]KUL49557.1 hypothetical protein ADL22_08375 [Streptomyces sp. NRRL F-4489]
MDAYAGSVLAERYRLPRRPAGDGPEAADGPFPGQVAAVRAYDTYSGQRVMIRQVPLPEVVDAEVVAADGGGASGGFGAFDASVDSVDGRAEERFGGSGGRRERAGVADRSPRDPLVRRALEAATAAAQLPDHPLLEQVYDVFAQDGSLWIVGEDLPARPLAALLAERPLTPHRAAEIAADLLTALRALHAHGWPHRNVTARTVLVCDDGRAVLAGLAAGAAQEALCGYDLRPEAVAGAVVSLAKGAGAEPSGSGGSGGSGGLVGLAAERARQTRLQLVGAVTERWAPELAGPADGGAAAPAGPAADLWAVGALLFRAVRGRPPFPEEDAAELVRLVRSRPPAPAAECGVLRPVVEALLCQEPSGRPGSAEVLARLREVLRGAPEPDPGRGLVTVPALPGAGDPRRLPVPRRRGELVRRGRRPAARPARPPGQLRRPGRASGAVPEAAGPVRVGAGPAAGREPRAPRSLGRVLLAVILLLMVAGIAYAMVFLPKSGAGAAGGASGAARATTPGAAPGGSPAPSSGGAGRGGPTPPGTAATQTTATVAPGFALRTDPLGFRTAVPEGWRRSTGPGPGQARYAGGGLELLVVPGRDTTARFGTDPMAYQETGEPELAAFRDSAWSSAAGLRRIDVGGTAMAEGTFTWKDGAGRQVYARNLALLDGGRYHLVLVTGPVTARAQVDRIYAQASSAYRPG